MVQVVRCKMAFVNAHPSEKNRQTVNDSPEATAMSWSMTTTPVNVPGYKATAHMLNEFVE